MEEEEEEEDEGLAAGVIAGDAELGTFAFGLAALATGNAGLDVAILASGIGLAPPPVGLYGVEERGLMEETVLLRWRGGVG